jgi:hypothetical protein
MVITVGAHLLGAADGVEVVVVRPPTGAIDIRYRGVPIGPAGADPIDALPEAASGPGLLLGKRYVDEVSGIEVLCVKPGPGDLSADGRPLTVKTAAQLPASD